MASNNPNDTVPKLALVLGSGGARGWAHFAVIKQLDALGIRPDIITGTSIGALIGAAYASGNLEKLEEMTHSFDWWSSAKLLLEVGMPRGGLIDGRRVKRLLSEVYGETSIEDLPIPFACMATDIDDGSVFTWEKGPLTDAVRSSISIPGVFAPHHVHDRYLVDGGLVDPLPIRHAIDMGAERTIAVDINLRSIDTRNTATTRTHTHSPMQKFEDKVLRPMREWFNENAHHNIFDIMTRTVRICENQITERCLADTPPDVLIQPVVGHINALEFHRGEEALEAGRIAAEAMLTELKEIAEERAPKNAH